MTVESSSNKSGPFIASGETGVFPRSFLVFDPAHVRVVRTRDGVETDITTGISHSGMGSASGTVTLSQGIQSGDRITLLRNVPNVQRSDYSAQSSVPTDQVELDLDLLAMQVQDLAERQGRSLTLPVDTTVGGEEAMQAALDAPRYAAEAKAAADSLASLHVDSLPALLSSTRSYPVGTTIRTRLEGLAYQVVSSAPHLTTAGGVMLRVLPDNGRWSFAALNPAGDGTTDDRPKFVLADTIGGLMTLPKPPVKYTLSTAYNFKGAVQPDPGALWVNLTDSGKLTFYKGFRQNSLGSWPNGSNIHRLTDRVFVGHAASTFAGDTGTPDQGTFYLGTDANGPSYIPMNAQMVVATTPGDPGYAIAGVAWGNASDTRTLVGVAAAVVSKGTGGARGFLAEVQHESPNGTSWGAEIIVKNASGAIPHMSPYETRPNMAFNLQLGAGDNSFGPARTGPNSVGIIFSSSTAGWHTGIQFRPNTLNMLSADEAEAIALSRNHALRWYASGGHTATIKAVGSDANQRKTISIDDAGWLFKNHSATTVFGVYTTGADENGVQITANTGAAPPIIAPLTAAADMDLRISGKGTGLVRFGSHTAGALTASGYITIKDASGTVRRLLVG